VLVEQFIASVISCEEIVPKIHLLWIEVPPIVSDPLPGQFLTIRCGEDALLRRPLSIHRVDNRKFALLFASVGQGTEWLADRNAGDSLDILGPLGNGFRISNETQTILLVAGGIGIAPLVYLAEKAVVDGLSVKMALGATTSVEINCLASLVPSSVEIIKVTNDGLVGVKGMVTDVVPSFIEWADQVFACGPVPMYRSLAAISGSFGYKAVQVLLEQVMACGVGACRGCAVSTNDGIKMVCQDGPVFDLKDIN